MNYVYIDALTGKPKKYIGNVIERDGKLYGTIVEHKISYSMQKLTPIVSHESIESEISYLAWKDRFGIEHKVSDEDDVKNGTIIHKEEYNLPVTFHPGTNDEHYFVRKDTKERFDGEVIEKNFKFYGKIEKEQQ